MKKICVVGAGYVGLVTGACFAELGSRVSCVDVDGPKVERLKKGDIPCYEPELKEMVQKNIDAHRLSFTTCYAEAVKDANFVFICVGTPPAADNCIDLSYLHLAYMKVVESLSGRYPIIVNKSTIPPGTSAMMESLIARLFNGTGSPSVVSNPEFLREGKAVHDFMYPSRVVVGAQDPAVADAVAELYRTLNCPILITDTRTAEMIKYASNAFLAMKVSFSNEMANICDSIGVNVDDVARGIGLDPRIGRDFLKAGIGYGGSCLPKDVAVLEQLARTNKYTPKLLNATLETNARQPARLVQRIKSALQTLSGVPVAVLGLSFKANTDDTRCSPAIELIRELQKEGAQVRVYDPKASYDSESLPDHVEYLRDPFEAAAGCEVVVVATDWSEFKSLNLQRLKQCMQGSLIADGRNILDPQKVKGAGLSYIGVGRGKDTTYPLQQAPERTEVFSD